MGKILKRINSKFDKLIYKICGVKPHEPINFTKSRVEWYEGLIEDFQKDLDSSNNEYDKEFYEKVIKMFEDGIERLNEEE